MVAALWMALHEVEFYEQVRPALADVAPRAHYARAGQRELVERYLAGLASAGVPDPPSYEEAWDDYRFFVHDGWDSSALTILWSGLHPPGALALGYERASAAVDDLAVDEIVERRVKDGYR